MLLKFILGQRVAQVCSSLQILPQCHQLAEQQLCYKGLGE